MTTHYIMAENGMPILEFDTELEASRECDVLEAYFPDHSHSVIKIDDEQTTTEIQATQEIRDEP